MFALGYEATGLGRRIALLLVKALGRRPLGLWYSSGYIPTKGLLATSVPSWERCIWPCCWRSVCHSQSTSCANGALILVADASGGASAQIRLLRQSLQTPGALLPAQRDAGQPVFALDSVMA